MSTPRPLTSRLTASLRVLLVGVGGLAAMVFADSLYLLAVRIGELVRWSPAAAEPSASRFFQVALLGHSIIGVLFVVSVVTFVALHLPKVWRRRRLSSITTGLVTLALVGLLLATGLFVLTEAATRQHRWVWWLHLVAAGGLPVLYVAHRRAAAVQPGPSGARRFLQAVAALTLAFGVGHALVGRVRPPAVATRELPASAEELALQRYGIVPPGFASPLSPYFPSPSSTTSGEYASREAILGRVRQDPDRVADRVDAAGFYAEDGIGAESCVRCHPDVTAQWEASAHRFSSFNNPFYESAISLLRSTETPDSWWLSRHRELTGAASADGRIKSRWCGACHDPALLFSGGMEERIDRHSPAAQAGLTCLACHNVERLHDRTGNGNYVIRAEIPDLYVFADATEPGVRRRLHDAALRARPDAHRAAMRPDLLGTPEFCGSCHKVSLREPLNDYRWLRGQDEFDNWEDSGVSLEGAHTFYLPPARRVCQDCHMPPEPAPLGDLAAEQGRVRSHRFIAANTALPFIRGDTASVRRIEQFLRDEKVSIDVFGVRTADGRREERGLTGQVRLSPGDEVVFDVVVRNKGVGHTFPGGTLDSNEGWLEVRLLDEAGRIVAHNGGLDADGHLDPSAHVYGAFFVDSAGRRIDRRNPQDIRTNVYANVIGPGTANLAHYSLRLPPRRGRYTLEVRLQWRKFNRRYSEFTFESVPAAFPGYAEAPALPVTTVAEAALAVGVGGPETAAGAPTPASGSGWGRWNDFGIASMREGSTRAARAAFEQVAELEPNRADGPMNLARVALVEGDVGVALTHLQEAERLEPADERIGWLRGQAYLAEGDYFRAAAAYRRVLEAFPRHRGSLLGLGRSLYLDGQAEAALVPLDGLLTIDPESRAAWYQKMLVLRSLERDREAAEAEGMVEYFRVDEAAGRLTRRIRAEQPGVNAMAQMVRTHRLREVTP